jgi:Nitrile hydratase, alpha chain
MTPQKHDGEPEGGQATPQAPLSDWSKQWSKLIAKAWANEAFKKGLLADPAAVLQEHGLTVPPGVQVKVVQNTDQVLYLMLPPAPSGELAEEDLEAIAAGFTGGSGNDTFSRR